MTMRADLLKMRPLLQQDAPFLVKWLSDERVLHYYEGRDRPHDLQLVHEHFYPKDDDTSRCLFLYDGHPIGYGQYYPLDQESRQAYGYDASTIIYGIDQFIGEPSYWDRGLGTFLVQCLLVHLSTHFGAQKVVLDPQASNARAIRCYEKCGFQKVKWLPRREWHEGSMRDCWLMEWNSLS
ncbi:GNAT family N-acetyltransferase [Brevibacillus centrosporus]|uniref:GNAT family N-acetyltransferase n=1 Tax=Brevibacillus centrosporus TaxID=54910 RepID=UPI003806590D